MSELTIEQKASKDDTWKHITRVRDLLEACVTLLLERGRKHDQSKLASPEVELFAEATPKLAGLTYGSDEYREALRQIKPAVEHHYSVNRHHPEFHANGVNGMTLIDLVEMLCDWKAASERHDNGDITYSIIQNATRFNLSEQLAEILQNTADELWLRKYRMSWHCFGCGAGGMEGNFCEMCGAGKNDYIPKSATVH